MQFHVLHVLTVLCVSPLLQGVINKTKAFFGGRRGPPIWQPYFDLWRLLHKGCVISNVTSWLFRFGPVANWVAVVSASLLIPLWYAGAPVSFAGDIVLFVYLYAVGRLFLVLAALDTGSAFEGMGAARETTFACLAEPAIFFCLMVLAEASHSLRTVEAFRQGVASVPSETMMSLLLVVTSWFLLMLAENCRIPFDDPNTHLELTMIHEVMVLDHSGPMLALIQHAAAVKLFTFAALIVRLLVPPNFGSAWLDWPAFVGMTLSIGVVLGTVESVMARLRMPLVPHVLTAAGVIAAFGFVLQVSLP